MNILELIWKLSGKPPKKISKSSIQLLAISNRLSLQINPCADAGSISYSHTYSQDDKEFLVTLVNNLVVALKNAKTALI